MLWLKRPHQNSSPLPTENALSQANTLVGILLALKNGKLTYVAFTLNGFDDQERNLTFVKTDFQIIKVKIYVFNSKQAFYLLHKLNTA